MHTNRTDILILCGILALASFVTASSLYNQIKGNENSQIPFKVTRVLVIIAAFWGLTSHEIILTNIAFGMLGLSFYTLDLFDQDRD